MAHSQMSNIHAAKGHQVQRWRKGIAMAAPTEDELEDFIKDNNVDSRAASDLRECNGEVQRKVIARGDLSSARNPSAALLARIRDARNSGSAPVSRGHHAGGSTPELEEFIAHNKVDESAADSLRSCSPGVQRTVIARGELKTARNPSSALLSRIRDAKNGARSAAPAATDPAAAAAAAHAAAAAANPALAAGYPYYPGYPYPYMGMYGYPGMPGYPPGMPPAQAVPTSAPDRRSRSRSRRSSSSGRRARKKKRDRRRGRSSSS